MDLRSVSGLRPDQLRLHVLAYGFAFAVSRGAAVELALPLCARCRRAFALEVSARWDALVCAFGAADAGCCVGCCAASAGAATRASISRV